MADTFIFNIIMASGSIMAALANFFSYLYIKKTYSLRNSLYFLLATDAILVSVTSLAMTGLYFTMAFGAMANQVVCGLQMLGYPMLADVLIMFGFSSSIIRYRRMKRMKPQCDTRDAKELKQALCFIFCFFIYYVLWVILSIDFDLKMFHLYNICLRNTASDQTTLQSWQAVVVCLPVVCCSTGTIICDCQALVFLYKYSNQNNKKVDNVALRGSVVGFLMVFPCMILCPILGYFLPMGTDVVKYYISFSVTIGSAILRNPVVALFTHNVNQSNQRMTAKMTRKANLLKILEEANERQAMLMAARNAD